MFLYVGHSPTELLTFDALSSDSDLDEEDLELCLRFKFRVLLQSIFAQENVVLTFHGIGKLRFDKRRVKMKFYESFLNSTDKTGKLTKALKHVSLNIRNMYYRPYILFLKDNILEETDQNPKCN